MTTATSITTENPYKGFVLSCFERNGYDDSDFYAVVWNPATEAVETHEIGSTRHAGGCYSLPIDASDEAKAAAEAYLRGRYAAAYAELRTAEATVANVGTTVKVVKGRKVPVGTVAEVVWRGIDSYKTSRWGTVYRVALLINGERVYVAAENVRVVDPKVFTADEVEVGRVDFNRPNEGLMSIAMRIAEAESQAEGHGRSLR